MATETTKFINAFETNELSNIMIYYQSFFNLIFPLYYTMLKHYSYSFYKEIFFLILEYVNLLIFLFAKPVSNNHNYLNIIIIVRYYMEFLCND